MEDKTSLGREPQPSVSQDTVTKSILEYCSILCCILEWILLGWVTAMGQKERKKNFSIFSLLSYGVAMLTSMLTSWCCARWSIQIWNRTIEMQTSKALTFLLLVTSWQGGVTYSVPGYCDKDGWGSWPREVKCPSKSDKTSDARHWMNTKRRTLLALEAGSLLGVSPKIGFSPILPFLGKKTYFAIFQAKIIYFVIVYVCEMKFGYFKNK